MDRSHKALGPFRRQAVLLRVAYDGTQFSGYQAQSGQPTIEGALSRAIAKMNAAPLRVRAASRTDAGVHALEQPVAFDPTRDIDAKGWLRGINEQLPNAISVQRVAFVPGGFEPRFQARNKTYRYLVSVGPVHNPLLRHRCWHIDQRLARPLSTPRRAEVVHDWLDVSAMEAAAQVLLGQHDFAAFQASNDFRDNTVREVQAISLTFPKDDVLQLLQIDVTGQAFLKNMVRIIAGTLVEVGRARMSAAGVKQALEARDRTRAGPTAPAHGLTLMKVNLKDKAD